MRHADAAAVRDFPELAGLILLRNSGWLFFPPRTADGELTEVDGFRDWPYGWIDAIRIRSRTDVMALRIDGHEPPGIVWEQTGNLTQVIDGLLSLPAPDDRSAPRLVRASAPVLWTP